MGRSFRLRSRRPFRWLGMSKIVIGGRNTFGIHRTLDPRGTFTAEALCAKTRGAGSLGARTSKETERCSIQTATTRAATPEKSVSGSSGHRDKVHPVLHNKTVAGCDFDRQRLSGCSIPRNRTGRRRINGQIQWVDEMRTHWWALLPPNSDGDRPIAEFVRATNQLP